MNDNLFYKTIELYNHCWHTWYDLYDDDNNVQYSRIANKPLNKLKLPVIYKELYNYEKTEM